MLEDDLLPTQIFERFENNKITNSPENQLKIPDKSSTRFVTCSPFIKEMYDFDLQSAICTMNINNKEGKEG